MHDKSGLVDSLTLDNDTAFAEHPVIGEALGSKICFCEPINLGRRELLRTVID